MSLFRSTQIACPACQVTFEVEAVHSVNADRRPDLRQEILDGSFQQIACTACKTRFRLDPSFNYLDVGRGQWIAAEPVTGLADWPVREAAARELFERAYGAQAGELAREVGSGLKPRLTFGWPAVREKLVAGEHGLDDVAVEACKAAAMRAQAELPFSGEADLRLVAVDPGRLVLAWVNPADNAMGELLAVPRTLYDEIVADEEGDWFAFKSDYEGALFVDMNRVLLTQEG